MKKILGNNKGFTLVELIVVITIMSVLAIYTGYYFLSVLQETKLSQALDTLHADVSQMKSESISGIEKTTDETLCYGLSFKKDVDDKFYVYKIYSKLIKLDGEIKCDLEDPLAYREVAIEKSVMYGDLKVKKNGAFEDRESVMFVFMPPKGNVVLLSEYGVEEVWLDLYYVNTDKRRKFAFDVVAGKVFLP